MREDNETIAPNQVLTTTRSVKKNPGTGGQAPGLDIGWGILQQDGRDVAPGGVYKMEARGGPEDLED